MDAARRIRTIAGHKIELDLSGVQIGADASTPEPNLAAHPTPLRDFMSAGVLAMKATLFDEGLLAAIEAAAQGGLGELRGKRGSELTSRLFGAGAVASQLKRADTLIDRVRSGELSLLPTDNSGLSDRRTWALDALLRPEATAESPRLHLTSEYRGHLLDLFKCLLGLGREPTTTQVPGPPVAGVTGTSAKTVDVVPEITVEPLATFYLRRAQSYRFLRGVLERGFGSGLKKLHRIARDGRATRPLDEELESMEALFHGAFAQVFHELGVGAEAGVDGRVAQADRGVLQSFLLNHAQDQDLSGDNRAMVPIDFDASTKRWRVRVVLGWSDRRLRYSFHRVPAAHLVKAAGLLRRALGLAPAISYGHLTRHGWSPAIRELHVRRLLDPEEMRALCDLHGRESEIVHALEGGP